MLYPSDTVIVNILLNIYEHMKKDYDNVLIVTGGTGDGKSRFVLNLFETWYRVILKRKVTPSMINQISQDYSKWLKAFKEIKAYDMNVFDESSRNLSSADYMSRISKDLNKLFDVVRCKKFFTVLILPNFFRLNKVFREERIRGLIHITKRGEYKYFTKRGITILNARNERRRIKSMDIAFPAHRYNFPDYKGVLLEEYIKQKDQGVDEVLDEVLNRMNEQKKANNAPTMTEVYKDQVLDLHADGLTVRDIGKKLGISSTTAFKIIAMERAEI